MMRHTLDAALLDQVDSIADWPEMERHLQALADDGDRAPGEESLLLLKLAVVQKLLDVEPERAVAAVADSLSLRRFCGLDVAATVPPGHVLEGFRRRLLRTPETRRRFDELVARSAGHLDPRPTLSIVSPVYRGADLVGELVRRAVAAAREVTESFEVILVDDGSRDESWTEILRVGRQDRRVKGVRLSRNFGQHLAITAGLDHARGDWVAVLDCDLQDDPADIPRLLAKALEGYDVVFAARGRREHRPWKNTGARFFNVLLRTLAPGIEARPHIGSFSILSRRAVEDFKRMGEVHRHYLGIVRWLGYDVAEVEVTHHPRPSGKSSYSFGKLLSHAGEGLITQSNRLLHLALGAGFAFLCGSLLATAYLVVQYYRHGYKEGWASTIVVILLSSSAILLALGAVGVYIGKIFEQVKDRPLYLVRQRSNL